MWQDKWGWREGCLIVVGLGAVGLALHLSIGSVPREAFAYPINALWALALLGVLAGYQWIGGRHARGARFFSGQVATLTSIGGVMLVLLLMGFTKQIPSTMGAELSNPIHAIGLSSILSTWYFLLLYVYMLFVLGCVTLRRIVSMKRRLRDFAFVMNHLGLFLTLLFGLMASADMRRYRMQVNAESEYPEWRGINEDTGQLEDLPLALDLRSFEIEEYPPKLMMISNSEGKPLPLARPQHLAIERVPVSAEINGWQVEVLEYLPYSAGVVTRDSIVFKEFHTTGAVHSAKVRAWAKGSGGATARDEEASVRGWVSAGSHLFPYRSLKLTDSLSLVMADPEPKQYSSHVMLYAENGDIDSAVIQVNEPLRYRGWYIYQLGYDKERGRWSTMSEFELVHDEWLAGVYVGIAMLFLGALCLFVGPLPVSSSSTNEGL